MRSTPFYDLTETLQHIAPLCISAGGHSQAAGCTFVLKHLPMIREILEQDVDARVERALLLPSLRVDAVLEPRFITQDSIALLRTLEPYGQGNPEPTFLVRDVLFENVRTVGGASQHLQATLGQCKAIGFHLGHLAAHSEEPLDLVCRLGLDTWNGRTRPQLYVQDMRLTETRDSSRQTRENVMHQ
jgi:single-stranded-DNA-specific exonuclease